MGEKKETPKNKSNKNKDDPKWKEWDTLTNRQKLMKENRVTNAVKKNMPRQNSWHEEAEKKEAAKKKGKSNGGNKLKF